MAKLIMAYSKFDAQKAQLYPFQKCNNIRVTQYSLEPLTDTTMHSLLKMHLFQDFETNVIWIIFIGIWNKNVFKGGINFNLM